MWYKEYKTNQDHSNFPLEYYCVITFLSKVKSKTYTLQEIIHQPSRLGLSYIHFPTDTPGSNHVFLFNDQWQTGTCSYSREIEANESG